MSTVNTMPLKADYAEMINHDLDRIPVRQKEDYKIVLVALKLLQANQALPSIDVHTPRETALRMHYEWLSLSEAPVTRKNNWLDSTPSWNDSPEMDLLESLVGLEKLFTDSAFLCEQNKPEFKALALECIAHKIDEIEKMTLSDVKKALGKKNSETIPWQNYGKVKKTISSNEFTYELADLLIEEAFIAVFERTLAIITNRLGENDLPFCKFLGNGNIFLHKVFKVLGKENSFLCAWKEIPNQNGFSVIISFKGRNYFITADLRKNFDACPYRHSDLAWWDGTRMVSPYEMSSRFKVELLDIAS